MFNLQGSNTTQQRLQEMVYEQWLHADLKDIVVRPCIPEVVAQQQRGQINGTFIVQVHCLSLSLLQNE